MEKVNEVVMSELVRKDYPTVHEYSLTAEVFERYLLMNGKVVEHTYIREFTNKDEEPEHLTINYIPDNTGDDRRKKACVTLHLTTKHKKEIINITLESAKKIEQMFRKKHDKKER